MITRRIELTDTGGRCPAVLQPLIQCEKTPNRRPSRRTGRIAFGECEITLDRAGTPKNTCPNIRRCTVTDLTDSQRFFIERYLDVATTDESGDFPTRWKKAVDGWTGAIDTVNAQISQLQKALKSSEDEELAEIGHFGLNAITGNHKVKIMASLREISGAGGAPDPSLVSACAKRLESFDAHLASDPRVAAVDSNPFGVPMQVVATLRPAINTVNRALRAAG